MPQISEDHANEVYEEEPGLIRPRPTETDLTALLAVQLFLDKNTAMRGLKEVLRCGGR